MKDANNGTNDLSVNAKELKELLVFGLLMGDGFAEVTEDGKFKFFELLKFKKAAKALIPAFKGLGNPMSRVKALTKDELQQLTTFVIDEFGVVNDNLEDLIIRTLTHACSLVELAKDWKGLLQKKK